MNGLYIIINGDKKWMNWLYLLMYCNDNRNIDYNKYKNNGYIAATFAAVNNGEYY